MLLVIDIGNTNINFGLFNGKRLAKKFTIPTALYGFKELKVRLGTFKARDMVICSVVPKLTVVLKRDLFRLSGKRPYIIGKDLIVPLQNLYRNPKQVGQDRLVNAYAAVMLYKAPLIVVDFGTAVTFDVISKHKEYLGGMILPGLAISLDTLAQRTALLPKVKLDRPKEFIGRDTKNSMLSGIVNGFAALTDDLTKRIKDKIGGQAQLIATGGNILLISPYCNSIDKIDRDLTLKGLSFIFGGLK